MLQKDIQLQKLEIDRLFIDRGYINSSVVDDVLARRGAIVCKPWGSKNKGLFAKSDFKINLREHTITCPSDQIEKFEFGTVVEFDSDVCDRCPLRSICTTAEIGNGRTVAIAENEQLQQRLIKKMATEVGREELRERTGIEHRLGHISQRQGNRARYKGIRKNTYDLRRAAAIQNLETMQRGMALN